MKDYDSNTYWREIIRKENILLTYFYTIALFIQLLHSLEELSTGFHKRWYLFKIPFRTFLTFEIVFSLFWILILLIQPIPYREFFQAFFLVLMFANGIQHIVWFGSEKRYVPGLITAIAHVIIFLVFYSKIEFNI